MFTQFLQHPIFFSLPQSYLLINFHTMKPFFFIGTGQIPKLTHMNPYTGTKPLLHINKIAKIKYWKFEEITALHLIDDKAHAHAHESNA